GMGMTVGHPGSRSITRCRCCARRVRGMDKTQQTARIVVVTGASAGVGRASAIEFARHGWRVALLARGREGLDGAKAEVEAAGGEAMVIEVDVADHRQVEAAADQVEREWGTIDVWVNNAMATIFADFM